MIGLYEAVTRKAGDGSTVGEKQKIDLADAIRMYTYNPAYAGFGENELGSIEAGKLADLALWSGELLGSEPEKLLDNKCLMTMIGGEIVYEG